AVNIAKIEALRAQGLLLPAGEAAFARRSEERSRVYSHERETPAELNAADAGLFQAQPAAWVYFCACPPGYRATVLHWVT
ncbi:YdeI/OmpD-associated family protein, partial [Acinetobacter baumannii]|nr:YdeI/OmpD-associated family protein [Acinetobacter baumannii]